MDRSTILFCLGPTNTGKTHRAIERMLEHDTGMIGLPLRLLAREVFDKVERRVGAEGVALVTGEEKRIPLRPRYWICTVEAMPTDRTVDFLAVDEIQLASHEERGHVFTERILHARGRCETWFMGSDTMRSVVTRLVPNAEFRRYPRLSELTSEGSFSLGALPRRSAVVAFSTRHVYELAEKLRARKGGAAIVHGGLSPRARNAQVGMFQAGEVDYLVATDAIGMGLNLDIDRVAFADMRKFDGKRWRDLERAELAQIAGRAGRHTKDGGFATFCREPLAHDVVRAIEQHRFPSVRRLVWRNPSLDFSSPEKLVRTLEHQPALPELELVASPEDTRTLKKVLLFPEVQARTTSEERIRLLWDICQIPDYRKLLVDEHARLVAEIYLEIVERGRLSSDVVNARLDRLARHSGDVDTITARISFTRTWNYVANQTGWVKDPLELQNRTRRLEDELSDALHEALIERFVARRRNVVYGSLTSTFEAPRRPERTLSEQLLARHGAMLAKSPPLPSIENALIASDLDFQLHLDGHITWQEVAVGRLRAGRTLLEPDLSVGDLPRTSGLGARLLQRLRDWLKAEVSRALGPISPGQIDEDSSALRGILYQMRLSFGALPTRELRDVIGALDRRQRRDLEQIGFHFGEYFTYHRTQLEPAAIRRRAPLVRAFVLGSRLWSLSRGAGEQSPLRNAASGGEPSFSAANLDAQSWQALGYALYGRIALRMDLAEELSRTARRRLDSLQGEILELTGLSPSDASVLALRLGGKSRRRSRRRRRPKKHVHVAKSKGDPTS